MDLFLNAANVAIFLGILYGVFVHHRRKLHVRTMITCMVLDVVLLLAVELSASAIDTAMSTMQGRGREGWDLVILAVHIAFALATLVMWAVQLVNGLQILKGRQALVARHALGARIFLIVRFGNLVTAFMV